MKCEWHKNSTIFILWYKSDKYQLTTNCDSGFKGVSVQSTAAKPIGNDAVTNSNWTADCGIHRRFCVWNLEMLIRNEEIFLKDQKVTDSNFTYLNVIC